MSRLQRIIDDPGSEAAGRDPKRSEAAGKTGTPASERNRRDT
jgi:hypothetical protein